MEIQGTHQFKAPLASVWDALMDPAILAKALPGGDALERVDENDYKAAMNVRVGPVQGRFEGKVTLTDVLEGQSYRMKVSGTGSPGFLNGEGLLILTENPDGTLITYTGDVQVGGRIAAVGQRLIESTAKSIIRQGLLALDAELLNGDGSAVVEVAAPAMANGQRGLEGPDIPEVAVPPASSSPAPSPMPTPPPKPIPPATPAPDFGKVFVDVAKDVVQDLASDYIPREKQPTAFAFILGALTMLLFVVLVRLVQRD